MLIRTSHPTDIQEEKGKPENPASQEEGEEDMSGTQFVCETVIRSLTLDAAPDHKPLQRKKSFQSKCLKCPMCVKNTVCIQKITPANFDVSVFL